MLNLDQIKRHLEAPQPGFLYEPRAFWDVHTAPTEGATAEFRFDSDNFYNGSKYPIVLTDILFDGGISWYSAATAQRGLTDGVIRFSSSGNQPLTRGAIPLRSLVSPVAFEPPSPYAANANLATGIVPQVGVWGRALGPLWNLCQWDFRHPIVIPRDGALTFSIGSRIQEDLGLGGVPVLAYLQFFEGGDGSNDFFQGNARSFQTTQERGVHIGPWGGRDGFVFEGGGGAVQPFPPTSVLSATAYRRQNATQAGSTAVRGFSLMFDQRDYNATIDGEFIPDPARPALQSVASSTPVKAKTSGCGSQESWWRDGAPLSLVSPTRTPALVGRLPVPITLQPGDGIDLELVFPTGTEEYPWAGPLEFNNPRVQMGVSFCGFAAIEA